MQTKTNYSLLLVVIILSFVVFISCQEKVNPLNGAWKMVSGTYEGPEFKVECTGEDRMCYKVISDDHFAVVEICPANPDSNLFTAVGKYNLTESTYTEMYEATNVTYKIGTSLTFNFKLKEDNTLWIIEAKQEEMVLHEIWERVKMETE